MNSAEPEEQTKSENGPSDEENEGPVARLVSLLRQGRKFVLDGIWEVDERGHKLPLKFLIIFVRLVSVSFRGFVENKCNLRAAALTYASVFSLIPILALGFAMAGAFKGRTQEYITKLQTVLIQKLAPGSDGTSGEVINQINGFIENYHNLSIGAVGAFVLVLTVVSMLTQVESALNEAWGVRRKRPISQRVLIGWGIVTLGTIILASSLSLTAGVAAIPAVKRFLDISFVASAIKFLTPYIITTGFLAFVYKFMPNTDVNLKPALLGGLAAGVMWETSKEVYVHYVQRMLTFDAGVYATVYSGMAAVPLFLLWLYLSWIVFLLGAEISFAVQNTHTYMLERQAQGISMRFKQLMYIRVMLLVGKYFRCKKIGPDIDTLVTETGASSRLLRDVTYDLCQAGVLAETAMPERRFTPALPLDMLTPHTVLTKTNELGRHPDSEKTPADLYFAEELLGKAENSRETLFKDETFDELVSLLIQQSPEVLPVGDPDHEKPVTSTIAESQ